MPDSIPSYVTAERFDRHALNGLADEARDRREDLRLGLVELVSALGHLRDAGDCAGLRRYLSDLARVAYDGIGSRDAQLIRDIDAAGQHAEPINLSELNQIIEALR